MFGCEKSLHKKWTPMKKNMGPPLFITQQLKYDQKFCDMLADLQNKRENEIAWKKARVYEILASVSCSV
ncbi:hypothetical protein Hanom_Chr05g00397531 [Helianthus anomalus]